MENNVRCWWVGLFVWCQWLFWLFAVVCWADVEFLCVVWFIYLLWGFFVCLAGSG